MPLLHWLTREADLKAAAAAPCRLLEPVPELSAGDPASPMLLQGDNLDALKALLPFYAGRVRRPEGGNVLRSRVLRELPAHDGPRVLYGKASRLGPERLHAERVTFRQIPYDLSLERLSAAYTEGIAREIVATTKEVLQ